MSWADAKFAKPARSMADIVAHAVAAFWADVAAQHPEITTGDLGAMETAAFEDAASIAVLEWLRANEPHPSDVEHFVGKTVVRVDHNALVGSHGEPTVTLHFGDRTTHTYVLSPHDD